MRYGDEDGFNEVYDSAGEPLLHPNESILVKAEEVVPSLKSTWRYYGGDNLLEPTKGTIYLTTERMIFINIPERMFAIGGGDGMRAMSSSMGTSFSIGESSSEAIVREYFEIPNIEIMASERKEGAVSLGVMVNVYVLSSGNQFHLSMVLDEESGLMKRLMNKRVESLDELVANLKEFFKRTDWIYLEGEGSPTGHGPSEVVGIPESPAFDHIPTAAHAERPSQIRSGMMGKTARPTTHRIVTQPMGTRRMESHSLSYFESLYNKGLLTEDIYKRLISDSGGEPVTSPRGKSAPSPPVSKPSAEPQQEPPAGGPSLTSTPTPAGGSADQPPGSAPDLQAQELFQPGTDKGAGEAQAATDNDLLNMLSDTIADIETDVHKPAEPPAVPEPVEQPAVQEPVEPPAVQEPVKGKPGARKIIELKVKQ